MQCNEIRNYFADYIKEGLQGDVSIIFELNFTHIKVMLNKVLGLSGLMAIRHKKLFVEINFDVFRQT